MLTDFKMHLPYLVEKGCLKVGVFHVREELSLDGLHPKGHYCGIKRRKKSRKRKIQVFLSLCRT